MATAVNGEDGYNIWQSLVRQKDLTAQLCSITRDVRNVRGGTQKKIEKLRQLLSGLLSELVNFAEVNMYTEVYMIWTIVYSICMYFFIILTDMIFVLLMNATSLFAHL